MDAIELKQILLILHKELAILKEQEAKYGTSLDLFHWIDDYQTAIDLAYAKLHGEISDEAFKEQFTPLNVSIHLFQRLLYGKFTVLQTDYGGMVFPSHQRPTPQPRPRPIQQRPRLAIELLDRQQEVRTAIATLRSGQTIEFYGQAGIGKSSLLHYLAHHLPSASFPDGIVYRLARRKELSDLCQLLFDEFYTYPSNVPCKPSEAELLSYLKDLQAVILLDDVDLERDDLEALLDTMPACALLVGSTEQHLYGGGRARLLEGLPVQDAVRLVERELVAIGQPLLSEEQAAARMICNALRGHPLNILQLVTWARNESHSLVEIATQLEQKPAEEKRAAMLLTSLPRPEGRAALALASLRGAAVSSDHLKALTGLAAPTPALRGLLERHLVQMDGVRYSLAESIRQSLEQATDLTSWTERALAHFITWVEQNQQATGRLLSDSEAILQTFQWAVEAGRWPEVLHLGRMVEPTLFLGKQWGAWNHVLQGSLQAARTLGDRAAEAWALHQLGTRALCLGDTSLAQASLGRALRLRERLGDQVGASITRHNLGILIGLPPPADAPPPASPTPAPPIPGGSWLLKGILALLPVLLVLIGVGVWPFLSPSNSIPPPSGPSSTPTPTPTVSPTPTPAPTPEAVASLSPGSLVFNLQVLQTPSEAQMVTLTNTSPAVLEIYNITLSGNKNDFSFSDNCAGTRLDPGGSCTIKVVFQPTATGSLAASLDITDNTTGSPHQVFLNGTGAGVPVVRLVPPNLEFGSQELGTQREPQIITLTNVGSAPLIVNSMALTGAQPGDFQLVSNGCANATIAPNDSCTIGVSFVPTAPGNRSAGLALTDNAAGSPHEVSLNGTGLGLPAVRLSPPSLQFSRQEVGSSSQPQTVTLTNVGSAPLAINSVVLTGAQPGDFQLVANGCANATIIPNDGCSLSLYFAPTALGNRSAGLTITDNAAGSPHSISLSGIGTGVPAVRLSPPGLEFGPQPVDTQSEPQSVTLTNVGSAPLTVNSITFGNVERDFILRDNCAGRSVDPGGSCAIRVVFQPATADTRKAILSIIDNAAGSPHMISVTGTGVGEPVIRVDPPALGFTYQPVGAPSEPRNVIVTNVGSAPLIVSNITFSEAGTDFSLRENCTGGSLDPGGSCAIRVVFQPQYAGTRKTGLVISHNAAGSPDSISVTGIGVGEPAVRINPSIIEFKDQSVGTQSEPQSVTLTNVGSAPLVVSNVTLTGAQPGDFKIDSNGCADPTIAPKGNCKISVVFKPTDYNTQSTAKLTISHNAANSPHQVSLIGTSPYVVE